MKKKRCRTKRVEKKRPRQRKSAIVNELDPKTNRYYSLLLLFVTFSFFFCSTSISFRYISIPFQRWKRKPKQCVLQWKRSSNIFFSISIREKEICIYCTFFLSLCFSLCFFFHFNQFHIELVYCEISMHFALDVINININDDNNDNDLI